jgi:hypothetical protein
MSYIYTEADKYQLACAMEVHDIYYKEWQRNHWSERKYNDYQLAADKLSEVLHNFIINRKESNRKRLGRTPRRLWSKLKRGKIY